MKTSKKKSSDDLLLVVVRSSKFLLHEKSWRIHHSRVLAPQHPKDHSGSKHSRDPSAMSDVSDDGPKEFCRAVTHNLAKSPDDLMFLKGDVIQVVEKKSGTRWVVRYFFTVRREVEEKS